MMMSLGEFVFTLPTLVYQQLSHRLDVRHARNERIGAPDAIQFIGPGEEVISLSGVTADGISNGDAAFAQLRSMMASGEGWPMIDGLGTMFGIYIIESLDRRHGMFRAFGQPRTTEFTIDLRRTDNPGGRVGNAALNDAEARLADEEARAADENSIASLRPEGVGG